MIDLPDSSNLLKALLRIETYPDNPTSVDMVQTQMSFIFLTGKYVYKIKKPVNLGYLDYTTLENRKYFCYQELELNQRLCPHVYLEVIPITELKGRINLRGKGKIIEYTVKMKQLPGDRMMDYLLKESQVTGEMIQQVAQKMAGFHQNAGTNPEISSFGKLDAIMVNINENSAQTEKYIDISISPHEYQKINEFNSKFTHDNQMLFKKRVNDDRIRDCHGDLHAAHVCFSEGVQIFDCIEFNDRFRYCDVASEIAFLAMDLERYEHAELGNLFVEYYVKYSGDKELYHLLNFYKCYRAYVRGKVESFKLDDRHMPRNELKKAAIAAKNYFHLAYRFTMSQPLLIIVSGLMGTGKTTIAESLHDNTGFTIVSSDVTRKKLAGIPITEHRFAEFDTGIYSPDFTQKTYQAILTEARTLLQQGKSVILDASFQRREDRNLAYLLATELKSDFLIIECTLNEVEIKQRLEMRMSQNSVSDGRWEIFRTQQAYFDKITEFPSSQHLIIDTSQPIGNNVKTILERI